MVRILIVASVRLYREGLTQVLARDGRLDVLGAAATVSDALEAVAADHPDVVLLDMGASGALDAIRQIRQAEPEIRVVALGVDETEADVLECAEAGAAGYLFRDSSVDELVVMVASTARGELHCSPRVAGALLRRVARLAAQAEPPTDVTALTQREHEVLELIDDGLTNKEIATALHIEVATVKNHVHHILEKLAARSRGEAAAKARNARRWRRSGSEAPRSGTHRFT